MVNVNRPVKPLECVTPVQRMKPAGPNGLTGVSAVKSADLGLEHDSEFVSEWAANTVMGLRLKLIVAILILVDVRKIPHVLALPSKMWPERLF